MKSSLVNMIRVFEHSDLFSGTTWCYVEDSFLKGTSYSFGSELLVGAHDHCMDVLEHWSEVVQCDFHLCFRCWCYLLRMTE